MSIATADREALVAGPRPNPESDPTAKLTTVLVVDDSPIDRRLARRLLEKIGGLRPIEAADGRELLEAIAREAPAVVLTDLHMPEIGGLELVEAVRARYPHVPVVLMTAHGSEEVAIRALQAGAASYVPKKLLAVHLAETLRRILAVAAVDHRRRRALGAMVSRESRFEVENDPELITPLIQLLQEDLDGLDFCDGTARLRIGVALQEALANALYHGNLEVSSDLRQGDERLFFQEADRRRAVGPYRGRRIHLHTRIDRDEVRYVVRDEGPGFDTGRLHRPIDPEDLMRVGGRGLILMRTSMDEVAYNPAGNQITLAKRGRRPEAGPVGEGA